MASTREALARWLKKATVHLPYLPRALALIWVAARKWTTLWALLLILQGLLPIATVYLTRGLVNALVSAVRSGGAWESVRATLWMGGGMGGVLLLAEILRSAAVLARAAQAELVRDHIGSLIHGRSIAADLAFYESPDYYDHLYRARDEASYRPLLLLDNVGSVLQNGITLVAMAAVLIPFGWWLPTVLALSTLPALYVVLRHALDQHQWLLGVTADERRVRYYDWVLTSREPAAELRLFRLGDYFQGAYQSLRARLRKERLGLVKRQSLAEMGAGALALALSGAAMAWMVWRAIRGQVSAGDLALFYQAFNQGLRLARTLLESVGQLYANILFLGSLFEFLELEPRVVDPPRPAETPARLQQGLRFHQVTFRYPGSSRVALQNFSLTIPSGQVVAVVGSNGAGKSTLIKLLCRFYDPDEGQVELDGVDLRQMPVLGLRRLITVLFQEPVHYFASAADNIAMGDLSAAPDRVSIAAAARDAGADEVIVRLPGGYDTQLGRWFTDGTELSVGEWQRIALARAFLRQAPVLILDEPTSAMDPWAEADWLQRFRRLAAGRTVLIVTHRFTTAMFADSIHVMADGEILESGNHEELLRLGGRYAQGWAAQKRGLDRRHRKFFAMLDITKPDCLS